MKRGPWTLAALSMLALAAIAGPASAKAPSGKPIKISVTSKGFQPAVVKVKAGTPVTLVVTRKTDQTCATEFVMPEYGIDEKLPLKKPVTIRFTPKQTGDLRYACAMDHVSGTVRVE